MFYRSLLIMLSVLALFGCKTTGVYHFVHEATESDRKSLQWSKADPQLTSQLTPSELPYLVVDFHSFWPGYSATAYLYVVEEEDDPIELTSITVRSPKTSEIHTSLLNVRASPKPVGHNHLLYRYRVIDAGSSDKFSEADSLQVTVKWIDKAKESITFELIKKTTSDIAWPT